MHYYKFSIACAKHGFSVRNLIAILLMILSVVCLFWPNIIDRGSLSELRSSLNEFYELTGDGYYMKSSAKTIRLLVNIAFFALIALASIAIILMLLKKTKKVIAIHTVVSFLTVILMVYYMIEFKEGPGISLFLLPGFSLASAIVYEED